MRRERRPTCRREAWASAWAWIWAWTWAWTWARAGSCRPPHAMLHTSLGNDRQSGGRLGLLPLPLGEGWGEGFRSLSLAGNPLTPTLSPNGERERTEIAAPMNTADTARTLRRL